MRDVLECQIWSARRILEGLVRTISQLLNNEAMRTLTADVKPIFNSKPLVVDILSDIKSQIPLSLSICLQLVLLFLHLVFSSNETCISEEDWNVCNILQRRFERNGEEFMIPWTSSAYLMRPHFLRYFSHHWVNFTNTGRSISQNVASLNIYTCLWEDKLIILWVPNRKVKIFWHTEKRVSAEFTKQIKIQWQCHI